MAWEMLTHAYCISNKYHEQIRNVMYSLEAFYRLNKLIHQNKINVQLQLYLYSSYNTLCCRGFGFTSICYLFVCFSCLFACVADPACDAEAVGHPGPAAMGVRPPHEHRGPVCAAAGILGGGEDGSLPPNLRAGIQPLLSEDSVPNTVKYYCGETINKFSKTLLFFLF